MPRVAPHAVAECDAMRRLMEALAERSSAHGPSAEARATKHQAPASWCVV